MEASIWLGTKVQVHHRRQDRRSAKILEGTLGMSRDAEGRN